MSQVFSNYAVSQLNANITSGATSMSITPLDGGKFQAPGNGDYELLTLTDGVNWEIVKCTSRTNDTFTIVRGYEGAAQAWDSGTLVKGSVTEDTLNNMMQKQNYGASIALFNYQNFR